MNKHTNHIITLLFWTILLLCSEVVCAQFEETNEVVQLQLLLEEMNSEEEESTKDVQHLLDELMPLLEHKIPINTATLADLESLFFLTPMQQKALLTYRQQYGDILSPYELPAVEGFDLHAAKLTALFLSFSLPNRNKRIYNKQELILRSSGLWQQQAGYAAGKFEGNAMRQYLRYRGNVQQLELGFTAEKDPGETSFRGENPYHFDYQSAFAMLRLKHVQSKIIVGDYLVQWGQGLTMWQGFSIGKSSDVVQIARLNEGIKPYGSTEENNFMRGAAGQVRLGKHWELMGFFSYKKIDANIDTVDNWRIIRSLPKSGLHRTASEINNKNAVQIVGAGAKLNYRWQALKLGLAYQQTILSLPIKLDEQIYKKYLFQGDRQQTISLTYQYNFNRMFLFGESASDGLGIATIHGLQLLPANSFSLSIQHRLIRKTYHALFASAQIESSRVNDEQGWYLGVKFSPIAYLTLNAYADFFQFSWAKYASVSPGRGREYLLQGSYQINREWELNVRYTYETKPKKITTEKFLFDKEQQRQSCRLQLNAELSKHIALRSKIEGVKHEHQSTSVGIYLAQDLGYTSEKENFKLWFRLAYFNTDDYNSRIYAYENGLRYQFDIPSFYGEGFRSYLKASYKIKRRWLFECKLGTAFYPHVESIGSGLGKIEGNQRSEWKLQVKYAI